MRRWGDFYSAGSRGNERLRPGKAEPGTGFKWEAEKLADAEMRIRLSIAEHRQGNDLGSSSLARSNLAEILVVRGRWAEAREALEEPRKIAHWRVTRWRKSCLGNAHRCPIVCAVSGRFQEAKREARVCPGNEPG